MKNTIKEIILLVIATFALLVVYGVFKNYSVIKEDEQSPKQKQNNEISQPSELKNIKTFELEEDFKGYLNKVQEVASLPSGSFLVSPKVLNKGVAAMEEGAPSYAVPSVSRYSETNVQVVGIDEPDIVKTNGKEIFISQKEGIIMPFIYPGPDFEKNFVTKTIKAFPPQDMKLTSKIDENGDLLLHNNTLVIIGFDKITAFDVSNPEKPSKSWEVKMKEGSIIQTDRLYEGSLYIVSTSGIDYKKPCPIEPFLEKDIVIPCNEIYHPIDIMPTDVTFNIFKIDTQTGKVEQSASFVGDSANTVVYMSKDNMYVTYLMQNYSFEPIVEFLEVVFEGILPEKYINKIKKLNEYDISFSSKIGEVFIIIDEYTRTLSEDERLKFENDIENKVKENQDKLKDISRKLFKTSIIKLSNKDLSLVAGGQVPGTLISQFSMDEYKGKLRIATSIRENLLAIGSSESFNDLYVLDENLNIIGKVLDFGKRERIYGVRFIEDKGYIVTFREIDPFFVVDLSDPKNPQIKGELKIPGYSSYLHPITKDLILGVGKEDNKVKVSLFDVSDPSDPKEIDRYYLEEFWSDILNTHHAFLLDRDHKLFFLPGNKGGYIFSYEGDKINLKKAITQTNALRALYINDYMYIISIDKIVVIDEITFERVNELNY